MSITLFEYRVYKANYMSPVATDKLKKNHP